MTARPNIPGLSKYPDLYNQWLTEHARASKGDCSDCAAAAAIDAKFKEILADREKPPVRRF